MLFNRQEGPLMILLLMIAGIMISVHLGCEGRQKDEAPAAAASNGSSRQGWYPIYTKHGVIWMPAQKGGGAMIDAHDDDPLDEDFDYVPPWDCSCDGDGMRIVCIDDMCRGSGGCGRYSDRSCYEVCSCERPREGDDAVGED